MRRSLLALFATLAWVVTCGADQAGSVPAAAPAIVVTINPEGRVSVVTRGELPASVAHGVPFAIGMEIINQGYITGRLEASLAGNPPAGTSLGLDDSPLKGAPHETRTLQVTLARAGSADLTIVFKLRSEVPDLGGLDRIHMLVHAV
jgi:hypothetical protein